MPPPEQLVMELITTHLHADFDALAAMVAVRRLYPRALMAFPGSQEKNVRDYIKQWGQYPFQRLKNIDIAKVSRLIVVDTRQPGRIGKLAACLTNPGLSLHLYDHHPDAPGDMHGDLEVVKEMGSTTTIIVEIFQRRGITITPEEAGLMLIAIHEDTGSFTFDSTTPDDLTAAAWLMEEGGRTSLISQFTAQELSSAELGLLNDMINGAITYTIRGIQMVVAKVNAPAYVDEFARLVRKFMVLENINVIFALARMGDRIYFIARSRMAEVNVGNIAQEFGGGGHASAASATIKDQTMVEAEEKLVRLLHKYVLPESRALDLMSAPVIFAPPGITINQAHEILTRYSITVLPIIAKERVRGLISRRVVEKAIFHGLGEQPVDDYMTTDFAVLPSSATMADIQEVIIGHRQRFIPVVAADKVIGVITRTDLLNILIKDPAHSPAALHQGGQPSLERNRNLHSLLVASLSKKMMRLLCTIGEVAHACKYRAYAVGGFVRDILIKSVNLDLDIVVEGDGIAFARRLAEELGGRARVHEKFNTAVVKLRDGFKIDVATARLEYYEYPAAMPTVELSSVKLDLFRRDFTINAMAIHLNPDKFGLLVDFFNCQNDLRDGQIRVLHNLSFVEDPTRIFRAIRFEQRLGFKLGKLTAKLMKNAIKMNMYGRFSGGRFFYELQMILAEENPQPAIYRLNQFKLLPFLHPALRLEQGLKKIMRETHRALAWYKRLYLDRPCSEWRVFLLALTARLKPTQLMEFFVKFEVVDRERQRLMADKLAAERAAQGLAGKVVPRLRKRKSKNTPLRGHKPAGQPIRASEIYRILYGLSGEALLYLMGMAGDKGTEQAVSLYVTRLRDVKTSLNGHDLLEMGYGPGPEIGSLLTALLNARLDGLVKNRAEEEKFLREQQTGL